MDPATFALIQSVLSTGIQGLSMYFSAQNAGTLTPEQQIVGQALVDRIRSVQELVTPYIKEPTNAV
jgi:hypothetical protein